jgi:hypothetical protein
LADSKESHHHHQEPEDKNQHRLFSFVQLDDSFIPSGKGTILKQVTELSCLLPVILSFPLGKINAEPRIYFSRYSQYPPPDPYLSLLPSRGPPCLGV